eukprot:3554283-Prymnesium_polylepis.1
MCASLRERSPRAQEGPTAAARRGERVRSGRARRLRVHTRARPRRREQRVAKGRGGASPVWLW